jgi:four helix bundle protein
MEIGERGSGVKADNPIQTKSYAFALRIVKLYRYLCDKKKEFVLSKHIVRSGTSIGANVEEAIGGQSRKDFLSKMSIAYKEARETHYWLRLLRDSDVIDAKQADSIIDDCEALLKLSGSIIKTTKLKILNFKFQIKVYMKSGEHKIVQARILKTPATGAITITWRTA